MLSQSLFSRTVTAARRKNEWTSAREWWRSKATFRWPSVTDWRFRKMRRWARFSRRSDICPCVWLPLLCGSVIIHWQRRSTAHRRRLRSFFVVAVIRKPHPLSIGINLLVRYNGWSVHRRVSMHMHRGWRSTRMTFSGCYTDSIGSDSWRVRNVVDIPSKLIVIAHLVLLGERGLLALAIPPFRLGRIWSCVVVMVVVGVGHSGRR